MIRKKKGKKLPKKSLTSGKTKVILSENAKLKKDIALVKENKKLKTMQKGLKRKVIMEAKKGGVELPNTYLTLVEFKKDVNGNSIVRLKKGDERAFPIQTNGNLPKTHKMKTDGKTVYELTGKELNAVANVVIGYITEFGTKKMKAGLMEVSEESKDLETEIVEESEKLATATTVDVDPSNEKVILYQKDEFGDVGERNMIELSYEDVDMLKGMVGSEKPITESVSGEGVDALYRAKDEFGIDAETLFDMMGKWIGTDAQEEFLDDVNRLYETFITDFWDISEEEGLGAEGAFSELSKWLSDDDILGAMDANELTDRFLEDEIEEGCETKEGKLIKEADGMTPEEALAEYEGVDVDDISDNYRAVTYDEMYDSVKDMVESDEESFIGEDGTYLYMSDMDQRLLAQDLADGRAEDVDNDEILEMLEIDMDEMRVYVGTYGKYNEGSLGGEWVDLNQFGSKSDFYEYITELHKDESDPEFMFQDWEGMPDELIGESWLDDSLFDAEELAEKMKEEGIESIRNKMEEEYLEEISADPVGYFINELGYDSAMLAESNLFNFDIEKFMRDLEYGGEVEIMYGDYKDMVGDYYIFEN